MGQPEARNGSSGEYDELQELDCVLLGVRRARAQNRPIANGVGEITVDVPIPGNPSLRFRARKCGTCALECVLAEYASSGPEFVNPRGEWAYLSQCLVLG